MKKRYGVAVLLAITAVLVLACSKPESAQKPASTSNPEPQAVSPAPQAPADTQQAPTPQAAAPSAAAPASDKVYVCDMGCEVVDHPGKCSMCGMTLKEVNRADLSFVCETCGFTSDKPGACPKDHTILVMKIKEKKA